MIPTQKTQIGNLGDRDGSLIPHQPDSRSTNWPLFLVNLKIRGPVVHKDCQSQTLDIKLCDGVTPMWRSQSWRAISEIANCVIGTQKTKIGNLRDRNGSLISHQPDSRSTKLLLFLVNLKIRGPVVRRDCQSQTLDISFVTG